MLTVMPRNLADATYMAQRSADQIFRIIKDGGAAHGLSAVMPAFASQLSEADMWDTVAYVRTFATAPAVALHIVHLRLSIWPEYDEPRVLVMFRGDMAPASAFPTSITVPIPKQADVTGAGLISAQNEFLLHPHRILPGEEHDTLELNLPGPRFFVELYYDPFSTRRGKKRFTYTFSVPYAVQQVEIDIQKPYEATDFVTEPVAMTRDADGQGGVYHRFSYRDLQPGESKSFTITYNKTSERPSVAKSPAPASGAVSLPANTTLFALGLLTGITVLYASGVFFWKGYQRRQQQTPPAPSSTASHSTSLTPDPSLRPNFCSSCGCQVQPAYAFCPSCGRSFSRP
jgi:hypothetical protein